jgi:hypothetical protein
MATLLADPKLTEKAKAANALVEPKSAAKQPDKKTEEKPEPKAAPAACKDPDMMEQLATYIAAEMNTNINSPAVRQMKELNSYDAHAKTKEYMALPFYLQLGPKPDFYSLALGMKAKALAIWTERVGQNRPWDHKPIIRRTIGGVWHKQGVRLLLRYLVEHSLRLCGQGWRPIRKCITGWCRWRADRF